MKTFRFNPKKNEWFICEVSLSPEGWEEFKKLGDFELYKKLNKYGDYEQLRLFISENKIELESHSLKPEKRKR